MTRESFGIALSRLAALVLAVAATVAIALAIAPGTALAEQSSPEIHLDPGDEAGYVVVSGDGRTYRANCKDGWDFVSWTVEYGEGQTDTFYDNPTSVSDNAMSVTAHFTKKTTTTYTLMLTAGEGGTVNPGVETTYAEGATVTISATPDDGYKFTGWTNVTGGVTLGTEASATFTMPASDVQATANFEKIPAPTTTYKISATSASSEGGTVTVDGDKKEAAPGDTVKLIATPTDRSWEFTGWTVEEPKDLTIADDGSFTMPSASVVVQGNFKKKDTPAATYKITVTAEPAEGGAGSADKQEAAEGDTVTLAAVALDGYEFVEWKTATSGVTITNNTFTMPASDVAVTAVFKKKTTPTPVTTYAIAYDANGGTGTMDKQSAEAGATITLTANAFKRDGYTFAGWNTAKDGSGTAYSDKASVKVEGDLTLYAQWKAASSSSNKAPKTGDTALPLTVAVVVAAIAAGALLAARRKMN